MEIKGERREEILAIFAHELRQPLASILFAIQWVAESPEQQALTREMCEVVERQSRYLIRMIDGVLEDCRPRPTKPSLHRDCFDLHRVVDDAVEATSALISMREHRLSVSLPHDGLWINADAMGVQQIVINLLTNAAKYTEPGGCIRLSVENIDGLIVIEVSDNGVGIAEGVVSRIFDLFCQGEEPSRSGLPGLGIGLALVKSLVERHGGTVSVQSAGIGNGSTFAVHLPGTSPRAHDGHAGPRTPARRSPATRFLEIGPMGDA